MKPMKLTDVGQSDEVLERYFTDDDWVMQQKFDGARCVCIVTEDEMLWSNDGTTEIKFAAARLVLPELTVEMRRVMNALGWTTAKFDGEVLPDTGEYVIFDVLEAYSQTITPLATPSEQFGIGDLVAPDDPLDYRLNLLARVRRVLIERPSITHVRTSPVAYNEAEKRMMWHQVVTSGVEGAVSKHVDSLYEYDTRTTQWVKHKLVKTADVEVVAARRTFKPDGKTVHTGSAVLRVAIDPSEDPKPWLNPRGHRRTAEDAQKSRTSRTAKDWRFSPRHHLVVGNASLIGKDLEITEGSVVEVSYLLWSGDAMVQPRIKRLRKDKTPDECNLAQFPKYSREVIA